MSYQWIKFAHVASAIAFVAVHGVSIALLYAARPERDRRRLQALLDLSGRTATAMYVTLVAIVVTGFGMALIRTDLFGERWFWAALIVLAVTSILMVAIAKPLTVRLRAACELRPSGVPRASDEELAGLLRSGKAHLVATIGFTGLGLLLYLMVMQPALGSGGRAAPAAPTTTTLATSTSLGETTTTVSADAALLARGREVFEVTIGCAGCHGVDGGGSGFAPAIAGRERDDIVNALRFVAPMRDILISESDLDAVARYLEWLGEQ